MKLKTMHRSSTNGHVELKLSLDGATYDPASYCGESHCDGSCGLPALILRYDGEDYKAHSSMVAVGSVFQRKPRWQGSKIYLPAEAGDPEKLINMMWW